METIYFVTLNAEGKFQIDQAAAAADQLEQGIQYGSIFVPPWAICRTLGEAKAQLSRTVLETGGVSI